MTLICPNCNEEQEFYKCVNGVQYTPADETGEVIDSFTEFEEDGSYWYECAICAVEAHNKE